MLREQGPCKSCHSLADIFGDSFNLEDVCKNREGMKQVDFILLHLSFQEDICDQLSSVNALLVVKQDLTKL